MTTSDYIKELEDKGFYDELKMKYQVSYETVTKEGEFLGYLKARYDSRKSFYKKARIFKYENQIYLVSYDTIVVILKQNKGCIEYSIFGYYSQTTKRHIDEILKQLNLGKVSTKELKNITDKIRGLQVSYITSYFNDKKIENYIEVE